MTHTTDVARVHLADYLAVGLHGAASPLFEESWGGPSPRAWPRMPAVRTDAPGLGEAFEAAVANGVASHLLDWDDAILGVPTHPGTVVLSAGFAAASRTSTVGDLVSAFRVGCAVAREVGRVVGEEHYARGWHPTTTVGRMAAAYATVGLLGGDANVAWRALQLAAVDSSGVTDVFGTSVKPLQAGLAAGSAVTVARLARTHRDTPDVLRPDTRLGRILGVRDVLAMPPGDAAWADAQGQLRIKNYPCCYFAHPLILVLQQLPGAATLVDEAVRTGEPVRVAVSPGARRICDVDVPASLDQARFSLPLLAAAAVSAERWTDGALGLADGSILTDTVAAGRARAFRVEVDEALGPFDTVIRTGGRVVRMDLAAAYGTAGAAAAVAHKLAHCADSPVASLARALLDADAPERLLGTPLAELVRGSD